MLLIINNLHHKSTGGGQKKVALYKNSVFTEKHLSQVIGNAEPRLV